MATNDNRASGADNPITAVKSSDKRGWNALIERYQPIINSVCRSYRLKPEEAAADVSQTAWMKVVDNLDRIREPRAIPAWIKTTAHREALALPRAQSSHPTRRFTGQLCLLVTAESLPLQQRG